MRSKCDLDLKVWCADDGTLVGRIDQIAEAADILTKKVAALGYHLEVDKSKLWWPTVDIELLGALQFEFLERDDPFFYYK